MHGWAAAGLSGSILALPRLEHAKPWLKLLLYCSVLSMYSITVSITRVFLDPSNLKWDAPLCTGHGRQLEILVTIMYGVCMHPL
jgi:hypothetical protein